jgi:hypothetical protein
MKKKAKPKRKTINFTGEKNNDDVIMDVEELDQDKIKKHL